MAAMRIVPTFDELEDRHPRLSPSLEAVAVDELAFKRCEEALGHGVVIAIPHRTHRGAHTHLPAALAEGERGVLATLIGVMDERLGAALAQRHIERLEHELGRRGWAIDQPTTRRLKASTTTARYTNPAQVGTYVTSATQS